MRNVRRNNGTWIFRIPGTGWKDQTIVAAPAIIAVILALVILWALIWVPDMIPSIKPMLDAGLLLVPLAIILIGVFTMSYLYYRGVGARYQVHLDFDTQTVTAYDRHKGRLLWKVPYVPHNLYMSQTRIHGRYRSYLQPALVYGDSRQDLVEFDVPSPRKTMLTAGSEWHLDRLMRELSEDLP